MVKKSDITSEQKKRNREFGDFIHKRRIEKELSLRKSAKLFGISPAYLCRIEKGELNPPLEEKIILMARHFDVDPDMLLAKAGRISSDLAEGLGKAMIINMDEIKHYRHLQESGVDVQFTVTITAAPKKG